MRNGSKLINPKIIDNSLFLVYITINLHNNQIYLHLLRNIVFCCCLLNTVSLVLMVSWLDDVIIYMQKFVIPLVLVDRCFCLTYPYGLFHKSSPSV